MPTKLQELVAIYRAERIRWGDVAIISCDEVEQPGEASKQQDAKPTRISLDSLCDGPAGITIKVLECPVDDFHAGITYLFYGSWSTHERHGRQFIAKTYVRCQPHGRQGIIRYLTDTCKQSGVGHTTAATLYEKFQGDAVRILRETPDIACAAVGMSHFTLAKAEQAAKQLADAMALENVTIDLVDLLGGRGFPRNLAKRAVQEWGNTAAALLRKNPYLMMRFKGAGYLRCDALYLELGGNPSALKRQTLAAWYALARDTEGHTWHLPQTAERGIRERVAGSEIRPVPALILAKRAGLIRVHQNGDGRKWIAEARKADNEEDVAAKVRELQAAETRWPDIGGIV